MKDKSKTSISHDYFSGSNVDQVAILEFLKTPLVRTADMNAKEALFEYLDLVSEDKSVKVLLIISSPHKMSKDNYIRFIRQLAKNGLDQKYISRLYNAINQIIMRIVGFNKIVLHADNGKVIAPFMNIGLACDYRIIGDQTVFQNPNIKLDLVPKGGGIYFLTELIGRSKTLELLSSEEDITAEEALYLGIVNKVVPSNKLREEALNMANNFANKPAHLMSGIKRLMSCY